MSRDIEPRNALLAALERPEGGWSMGSFGAIAEFMRDADEPTGILHNGCVATERGALRFEGLERVVPVAYETLSSNPHCWG